MTALYQYVVMVRIGALRELRVRDLRKHMVREHSVSVRVGVRVRVRFTAQYDVNPFRLAKSRQ